MADAPRKPREKSRPRGKPFAPGNAGKPRGARSHVTMLAEKLMADDAGEIVKSVIAAAKGGDMTAAKIVLDRIAPLRKGRPVTLDLPPVQTASDIAAAMAELIKAMTSDGDITPDEAAVVASVLEVRRKALETEELERRIADLEAKNESA